VHRIRNAGFLKFKKGGRAVPIPGGELLRLRFLAGEGIVSVGGFIFQVLFPAALALSGAGFQDGEDIPIIALDAVVASHR